jgi:hypothetical protein
MRLLKLNNTSLRAIIDDEDFERCDISNWHIPGGNQIYSTSRQAICAVAVWWITLQIIVDAIGKRK